MATPAAAATTAALGARTSTELSQDHPPLIAVAEAPFVTSNQNSVPLSSSYAGGFA
jgi:hypothetical protein